MRDSIRAVVFTEGVTTVGDYAFAYCEIVHAITFADSITALQLETLKILNPECSIYDNRNTICNASLEEGDRFQYYFSGTIRGYDGSTAQAYAENTAIPLNPSTPRPVHSSPSPRCSRAT